MATGLRVERPKRIVLTGADGFLGQHLQRALVKAGHTVIAQSLREGWDVTNRDQVLSLPRADVVFHLAALTSVPESFTNPDQYFTVNTLGTLHMLEYCAAQHVQLLFPSTYVYGPPQYLPVDEEHPVQPANPYATSKYLAEMACEAAARQHGLPVVIFRQFNIYGPGQTGSFLFPSIFRQLGQKELRLADPRPARDYVYVDDVVDAYLRALQLHTDGLIRVNIGSGTSITVRDLVTLIQRIAGVHQTVRYSSEQRPGEVLDVRADIRSAEKVLQWKPRVTLEEGIQRLVETWKQSQERGG